jgi:deoxyribodipyrimidine photo-lyase
VGVQLVWFKKDLRISDHAPLTLASKQGAVLCVYVYEPELVHHPEFDSSHLAFINQSLAELDANLRQRGSQLVYRVGNVVDVFAELTKVHDISDLWSHQETGHAVSFARDKRVAQWAKMRGIHWHEIPQQGVVRGLTDRKQWAQKWYEHVRESVFLTPERIASPEVDPGRLQLEPDLGLPLNQKDVQVGGEQVARDLLASFLTTRGRTYQRAMSSPVTAFDACSRLSPHLTFGTMSVRTAWQQARDKQNEWQQEKRAGAIIDPKWFKAINAFSSRLRWRDHFIQRLETEPTMEFHNLNRAYDGLREDAFNRDYFDAWCAGQTGFPMVDASMRALLAGSWINFRMRAMVVSFASYYLWLHWRETGIFLARHFIDNEPGIHWSQFQMQSGVTGINTVRIYSPAKQVHDHDPSGMFIRRFVPELANVPDEYLAKPHTMPPLLQSMVGCEIGKDYPAPIVEVKTALQENKARLAEVRNSAAAKQAAARVLARHSVPNERSKTRYQKPSA